jgi:Zn-dependent M16 (insulinase) family peptidase
MEMHEDEDSGLRVVFVFDGGPLCRAVVVVPTEAQGDSGLPHVVEHLVFQGSARHPQRGVLDLVAARSLAGGGTNAATAEDHTRFTVSCAGALGLAQVLPVLLDHVANPTLTPTSMLTEVFALEGSGDDDGGSSSSSSATRTMTPTGVVFCEMLGRENSEGDLCDCAVRRLAFPSATHSGYAADSGGRTEAIAQLTHADVCAFHARFYTPDKMVVLVIGQVDDTAQFLAALGDGVTLKPKPSPSLSSSSSSTVAAAWSGEIPRLMPSITTSSNATATSNGHGRDCNDVLSKVVRFPSEDEDVGSVVVAWRGPSYRDVEACTAIEVLCRYLEESAASPLRQRFVEKDQPLASDATIDIRPFKETLIELAFLGVPKTRPRKKKKTKTATKKKTTKEKIQKPEVQGKVRDGNGSRCCCSRRGSTRTPTPPPEEEEEEEEEQLMLTTGVLKGKALKMFGRMKERGYVGQRAGEMAQVVRRHRIKQREEQEEAPQDTLEEQLVPDVLFCPTIESGFGARVVGADELLSELEQKPDEFWVGIVDRWFVTNPCVEVVMVPEATLADEIEARRAVVNASLLKKMTKKKRGGGGGNGLMKMRDAIAAAKKKQLEPLPESVLATLPAVPPASSIPAHIVHAEFRRPTTGMTSSSSQRFPMQVLRVQTAFVQVRVCFDLRDLPSHLRPFLVLFQELLLTSPMAGSDDDDHGNGSELIPYTRVVQQQNEELVSLECGVGFGSTMFGAESCSDVFEMSGVSEPDKFGQLCRWMCDILCRTEFTVERVVTAASNLGSDVSEAMRDGASVCEAASTLVTAAASSPTGNDVHLGVLVQQRVLEQARKAPGHAVEALTAIRQHLVWCGGTRHAALAQFTIPNGFADPVALFCESWKRVVVAASRANMSMDRQERDTHFAQPYQIPRGTCQGRRSMVVGVGGVESAFVRQWIECEVGARHEDFFGLQVLVQLLSRTEGPLQTRIRGAGLAYDAGLEVFPFAGLVGLELHECEAPDRALAAFRQLLGEMAATTTTTTTTGTKFEGVCSEFQVETARAVLQHHQHADRGTVAGLAGAALRGIFAGGFETPAEESEWQARLDEVDVAAVRRAFERHLLGFLDPRRCVTVVVTGPGRAGRLASLLPAVIGVQPEVVRLKSLVAAATAMITTTTTAATATTTTTTTMMGSATKATCHTPQATKKTRKKSKKKKKKKTTANK